jgi:PAS domain S-box-containing protein
VFCNRDGIIAEANHQAQVLSGAPREQLQGTHIRDYFTPEELDDNPLRFDLLLQGKSVTKERNLLRQDGTSIPVEMRSKMMPDGSFHTFIRDIRHRRRVEEQMAKQQRLESLGLLAGGIAHDFNNLLTGVYGCIELARASLPEHLDIQESVSLLTDARVSIDRARDLSNQLLTFSRGGAPAKSLCSLREPVKRCLKLSLAGSGVRSQVTIPDNLWPCEIDRGQISQVISNILINALQAMSDAGTIAVTCRNTLLKPDNSLLLEPGAYVAVEIEDSGEGIPPEILPRVFDPFVTTKPNGSGLGLAISHSIVKRHGGHIGVTSAFESGTRFTIHLPAAPDKTASPDSPLLFAAETSKRKILVVDDDETVLNVFRRLLEHAGYEAATAASGSTAVKLYTEHRESEKPFDLVILDLTIRGEKGGVEILGQLKAVDPTVVAIATSGYSNDPVMADPASFGFAATLAKPFEAEMLIRKLQSLPTAP